MKNIFTNIKNWWVNHAPSKRRLIQLYSALLFNSYIKGYIKGDIFKGTSKMLCTPGLNCYSCPGAVTSCPLGSLQNAFTSANKTAPYYMIGIIMLYGIIFGKWICGWLCPFGLIQDLLHKIKTPKLKKSRFTWVLSFFKYVLLVIFVVILPLIYMVKDFPLPAFCKYICPAGTLDGAIGLLINPDNEGMFAMLGPLFTWKFILMISLIVGMVFVYRLFCRFLCPLGAIYGLFNKFSLFGITLDKSKCINCGKCISICELDIHHVGDHECISCGKCIDVCPTQAIHYKGAKIILPDSEIEAARTDEEKKTVIQKRNNRVKLLSRITALVLAIILTFSIVYFNFIYDDGTDIEPPVDNGEVNDEDPVIDESIPIGNKVGNRCPAYNLELINRDGTVSIADFRGKIVIINFWGTWCAPCKEELPDFDQMATEYADDIVVLAIHTVDYKINAAEYVEEHFSNSKMVFAYDTPLTSTTDMYYTLLGGKSSYPRTVIIDEGGVIRFAGEVKLNHTQLVEIVESIKTAEEENQ